MQTIIQGIFDAVTNTLSANTLYYDLVGDNIYYAFRKNVSPDVLCAFLLGQRSMVSVMI